MIRSRPGKGILVYILLVLTAGLTSAVFYVFGIVPLTHEIHDVYAQKVRSEFVDTRRAVQAAFQHQHDIVSQIASRSAIRARQVDYLDGGIDRAGLAAFAVPKLRDAIRANADVLGITRYDPSGTPLYGIGEAIPAAAAAACAHAPDEATHLARIDLRSEVGPNRFAYCSHLVDPERGSIGFDVVTFSTAGFGAIFDAPSAYSETLTLVSSQSTVLFTSATPANADALRALAGYLDNGREAKPFRFLCESLGGSLTLCMTIDDDARLETIHAKHRILILALSFAAAAIIAIAAILLRPIMRALLAERHLSKAAVSDYLTGLLNFGGFHQNLERELARAARYRHPVSVLMFDIDFFKQVNDRHGHLAGDAVLRRIGELCRQTSRQSDFWARYGGEEFAAILPETDAAQATELANRLRLLIAETPFHTSAGTLSITVSGGVATWVPAHDEIHVEEIIGWADRALYASKTHGRNRISLAEAG